MTKRDLRIQKCDYAIYKALCQFLTTNMELTDLNFNIGAVSKVSKVSRATQWRRIRKFEKTSGKRHWKVSAWTLLDMNDQAVRTEFEERRKLQTEELGVGDSLTDYFFAVLATLSSRSEYVTAKLKHYKRNDLAEGLIRDAEPLLWQTVSDGHRYSDEQHKRFTAEYQRECYRQLMQIVLHWERTHKCDEVLCDFYAMKMTEVAELFLQGQSTKEKVDAVLGEKPKATLKSRYKSKKWDWLRYRRGTKG